jgi:hypothetical protein
MDPLRKVSETGPYMCLQKMAGQYYDDWRVWLSVEEDKLDFQGVPIMMLQEYQ